MVPKVHKSLKRLCFALPLLLLMLFAPPALPLAESIGPPYHQPTAIICLIGSIC